MILVDANVLLRLGNRSDPEYLRAHRIIAAGRAKDKLVLAPQSLFEFWAVATRSSEVNGIGMEAARAANWIRTFVRMFPVLPERAGLLMIWASLVEHYGVRGFRAHDVRYVALMQMHGIQKLLTYNVKHFEQFPITIFDPRDAALFA